MGEVRRILPLLIGLLVLASCTEEAEKAARTPDAAESVTPSPTQAPEDETPQPRSPWSLPSLMDDELTSERPRRLRVSVDDPAYTEYEVRYRSGDLRVSGVLLIPTGKGPFPGVVLNHGYIEPSVYATGQGLSREQDYLARQGFAVLHTDYRGHASSDPAGDLDRETRLGYTRDAINAVHALAAEPKVDGERMAMLGRSMGGGVTMNALVAQPGLVDAAVLYASVSSDYLDNLRRWTVPERPEAAQRLFDRFGTPQEAPGFYDALSARSYFDRIDVPVLSHHGTLDDSCPLPWARTTHRLMRRAGVRSTLEVYDGEQHAFGPQWTDSMETTVAFLRRHLRR